MKIIAVVNQKGGTGKTTTILNVSRAIAGFGKKVLIIDFDPQANLSSGLGIRETEKSIYDVLSGKKSLRESIVKIKKNFDLIPASSDLAGANIELVSFPQREFVLANILEQAKLNYDYLFIDTPPSLGLLTLNSLTAAQNLLIPVQAEYYALEGLGQLLQTIDLVRQQLIHDLNILGAVITMYDERSRLSQEVLEELYKNFPARIFRTVIPRNIRLAEAPSFSQSIFEYAPKSKGALRYKRLAKEVLDILKIVN